MRLVYVTPVEVFGAGDFLAEGLERLGGGRHLIGGVGDVTVKSRKIAIKFFVILGDGAEQNKYLFGFTFDLFSFKRKKDGLEMGVKGRRGDGINAKIAGVVE